MVLEHRGEIKCERKNSGWGHIHGQRHSNTFRDSGRSQGTFTGTFSSSSNVCSGKTLENTLSSIKERNTCLCPFYMLAPNQAEMKFSAELTICTLRTLHSQWLLDCFPIEEEEYWDRYISTIFPGKSSFVPMGGPLGPILSWILP